jgi:uroporphyrinogen-III synthase
MLERSFGAGWRLWLDTVRVISIGPQTSLRCRKELGRVDGEADPHDLDGLVAACGRTLRDPP